MQFCLFLAGLEDPTKSMVSVSIFVSVSDATLQPQPHHPVEYLLGRLTTEHATEVGIFGSQANDCDLTAPCRF